MKTATITKRPAPQQKAPPSPGAVSAAHARKDEERKLAIHTGHLIRTRRRELGYSQEKLGDALGLTFQQIQKYEKGTNRTSGPTLTRLAAVLKVPVTYFLPEEGQQIYEMPAIHGTLLNRIETLSRQVERLAEQIAAVVEELKAAGVRS